MADSRALSLKQLIRTWVHNWPHEFCGAVLLLMNTSELVVLIPDERLGQIHSELNEGELSDPTVALGRRIEIEGGIALELISFPPEGSDQVDPGYSELITVWAEGKHLCQFVRKEGEDWELMGRPVLA